MISGVKLAVGCILLLVGTSELALGAKPRSSSWGSLSIQGAPATSIVAGQSYSFQPTANSPNAQSLSFSVANKPAWASFSIASGKLWGVPTQAGTYAKITISVSDGNKVVSLAPFSITVTAPLNRPPTISGVPATKGMVDLNYLFRPTASDPDGDRLTFSIANAPVWAAFDAATGALSGTPTAEHVGTYSNITIRVEDGRGGLATLAGFSISIAASASGHATVSWLPPTQNTDNTTLLDLSGYRIHYGTVSGGPYSWVVNINNPSVTTYLIENLSPGTYYFVVTARNSAGTESSRSNEASKIIN